MAVYLKSYTKQAIKYSCDAQANFKLHPQQTTVPFTERALHKRTYTDITTMHEIADFIDYSHLMNHYVIDNHTIFEIEISTFQSKRKSPGFQQIYSRIHILLDNVSQLNEIVSSEVIVRDVRWKVRTERINLYLEAAQDDLEKSSTYDITATIKLLRFDKNMEPIIKRFTHEYHSASTKAGISPFLQWSQFMDKYNKYVLEDKAHFLVEFNVAEPKSLWDIEKLISIN